MHKHKFMVVVVDVDVLSYLGCVVTKDLGVLGIVPALTGTADFHSKRLRWSDYLRWVVQ